MMILIVDGQGGGIGKALVEKLNRALAQNKLKEPPEIVAVGTNSIATAAMIKAGAASAATGENAVIYNAARAHIIAGAIGIISANSMLGELSPKMAEAISSSKAVKILIPLNRCNLQVVGTANASLPQKIDEAVKTILEYCN